MAENELTEREMAFHPGKAGRIGMARGVALSLLPRLLGSALLALKHISTANSALSLLHAVPMPASYLLSRTPDRPTDRPATKTTCA